ncbi:HTH domain-containing protein [Aquimarina algiphila]|uniref:HTH domain-containing protein n=1 Tax=Aquimarina algiphila TaxID=2047982 RepID=A0A554VJP1_9FLAO|nr:HTH domain-containing protein [Aquimarina algiphila]TSE08130.1 HTH domain-containing protein [Aquimarina algiphila]
MSTLIKQIEFIEYLDQLIRLKATGTPEALAYRLGVSKTKVYRLINIIRELNAPIEYDFSIQSYVYETEVSFKFGFYTKGNTIKKLNSFVG